MSDDQVPPELEKQNQAFGYKAPESVYQKHDPKATLVGSGKELTKFASKIYTEPV
jgi:hypothetical protein